MVDSGLGRKHHETVGRSRRGGRGAETCVVKEPALGRSEEGCLAAGTVGAKGVKIGGRELGRLQKSRKAAWLEQRGKDPGPPASVSLGRRWESANCAKARLEAFAKIAGLAVHAMYLIGSCLLLFKDR